MSRANEPRYFPIETTVDRGAGRPDLGVVPGSRVSIYQVRASRESTGRERSDSVPVLISPRLGGIQTRPASFFLSSLPVSSFFLSEC